MWGLSGHVLCLIMVISFQPYQPLLSTHLNEPCRWRPAWSRDFQRYLAQCQHLRPIVLIYHQLQLSPNGTSHHFTLCASLDQTPKSRETTWFALTKLIQAQLIYYAPVPHSPSKRIGFWWATFWPCTFKVLYTYSFSQKLLTLLQLHIHIRHTRRLSLTFTPKEFWSQLYYFRCLHYRPSPANSRDKLS